MNGVSTVCIFQTTFVMGKPRTLKILKDTAIKENQC